MQSNFVEINEPMLSSASSKEKTSLRPKKFNKKPWLLLLLLTLGLVVFKMADNQEQTQQEQRYEQLKTKLFASDLEEEEMAEFCKLLAEVKGIYVEGCSDCKHYIRAKLGGRHSAHLRNYDHKPTKELEKGIKKYQKQIDLHKDKISNPELYCEGWEQFHPNRKETLLNTRWPKDIQRNTEQQQILECILKNRMNE